MVHDAWKVDRTTKETSPTLFDQWCGFFYVPFDFDQWKKNEGNKSNGFTSLPNDAIILKELCHEIQPN